MGLFDVHCSYSGVALSGDTQLVLLLGDDDAGWVPISAPFRGTYDRLGGLDEAEPDEASHRDFSALVGFLRGEFGLEDFETALEAMRDREITWHGKTLSYALVDAGVYDALAQDSVEVDPRLPSALRTPAKKAVQALTPIDIDDSDQYTGLTGKYGCRQLIERAEERFSEHPALLAAIEANAREWAELDD